MMTVRRKKQMPGKAQKWWVKQFFSVVMIGAVLFLSSGDLSWGMAWAYLGSVALVLVANAIFMDRDLMVERAQLQQGTKTWDIHLSVFVAMMGPIIVLLMAGLDKRFAWSQGISLQLQIGALVLLVLGGLLGTWSMAANKFFSATVRIQSDRKHKVVSSGPYRYIRHPGYAGGIIAIVMVPIVLGSWVALIPAVLVVCGYILRTDLEDKTLQNELAGYREYTRKVRHRLLPGVW